MIRLLSIFALACLVPFAAEGADRLHIACIGDSITQGRGGDKPEYSWRYPFWKLLIDRDIDHVFVGSMVEGFNSTPPYADYKGQTFSNINEGHWGWTTRAINDKLEGWVADYPALDVALVQLGTNDRRLYKKEGIGEEEGVKQTGEEYRRLAGILRAKNPKVIIVFGECMHAWAPFPAMNKRLAEVASELNTPESPVTVAMLSKGWISPPDQEDTDTIDWVHTSVRGDEKIAKGFWAALAPLLKQ